MFKRILATSTAFALLALIGVPVTAKPPCRDGKGKFVKCVDEKPKAERCRNAKGQFAKCGTPGAKPAK